MDISTLSYLYRNPVTKQVTITNANFVPSADDILMSDTFEHAHETGTKDDVGAAGTHALTSDVWELFARQGLPDYENYYIRVLDVEEEEEGD